MSKIYDYMLFNFYTVLNYIYYNLYKIDHNTHDNSETSGKKNYYSKYIPCTMGKNILKI